MREKRKKQGHYCKVCECYRANEKFSGKGHRIHVCKECSKKSKKQLIDIQRTQELLGYWGQRHISKKNINRISVLSKVTNSEVSELAKVILEVSTIYPHRKKRIPKVFRENEELIPKLEKVGLIYNSYDADLYLIEADTLFDEGFDHKICTYESDETISFDYLFDDEPF